MSKQTVEHSNEDRGDSYNKGGDDQHHLKTLNEEGAVEYFIETLNSVLKQRAIETFTPFLELLPSLYESNPNKYETDLAEILWGTLQHHDPSRTGLVNVLLNAVNEITLKCYLQTLIKDEMQTLRQKSPFRLSLTEFYNRWVDKLKGAAKGDYREDEMKTKCAQMHKIYLALTTENYNLNARDKNGAEKVYPDDELVAIVESILAKIIKYKLDILGFRFNLSSGFEQFLDELKDLNSQRLSKKFQAYDKTLLSLDFDVLIASRMLLIENTQRPYLHRILNIIKALTIQNEKQLQRMDVAIWGLSDCSNKIILETKNTLDTYIEENATLKQSVIDLKEKLEKSEREYSQLRAQFPRFESRRNHHPSYPIPDRRAAMKDTFLGSSFFSPLVIETDKKPCLDCTKEDKIDFSNTKDSL
jgi:hypothetical protein